MPQNNLIHVPLSHGETFDKISILEIKTEKMSNPDQLKNIQKELDLLNQLVVENQIDTDLIHSELAELKKINLELWKIEDDIRDKERAKEFDQVFIDLARSVYFTNDKRAAVKKEINQKLGSALVEEKSYQDYA